MKTGMLWVYRCVLVQNTIMCLNCFSEVADAIVQHSKTKPKKMYVTEIFIFGIVIVL